MAVVDCVDDLLEVAERDVLGVPLWVTVTPGVEVHVVETLIDPVTFGVEVWFGVLDIVLLTVTERVEDTVIRGLLERPALTVCVFELAADRVRVCAAETVLELAADLDELGDPVPVLEEEADAVPVDVLPSVSDSFVLRDIDGEALFVLEARIVDDVDALLVPVLEADAERDTDGLALVVLEVVTDAVVVPVRLDVTDLRFDGVGVSVTICVNV